MSPRIAIATRDIGKLSETFVRRHVAHLFGGQTSLITHRPPPEWAGGAGRPAHLFPEARKLLPRWRRPLIPILGHDTRRLAERDAALSRHLAEVGATHLLCEFGYVAVEMEQAILRTDLPVYCYFRGSDATKSLRDPGYVATLRRLWPRFAGVVAVSQFLLDQLAATGLRAERAIVVPSGTDLTQFTPKPAEAGHLLTVGRLVAKKDPLLAFAAVSAALQRDPDLRWTIVGSGPLERDLRQRIDAARLADRIVLRGGLPHDEVADLMCRADVYVQAFRTAPDGDAEGMPSVIQEAMAAGRAIVTARHAGIPEHIVHGQNGLLFDEGDHGGLTEALDLALSSERLRRAMGAAARAHAEDALDYRRLYARLEAFMTEGERG
jgi:glycosyltransferase involved in cell wall biosynthesis